LGIHRKAAPGAFGDELLESRMPKTNVPKLTVAVSLLRAVNLGAYNKISMAALKTLYDSLGCWSARRIYRAGNVVFKHKHSDLAARKPSD